MKATIIAAIITGFFTILAGVATYWLTQKEPALTYSVSESPVLPGSGTAKKIVAIQVNNSGKKEINGTFAQVQLKEGAIDEAAAQASPGVKLAEDREQRKFSVTAGVINPGEYLKLSLLISSKAGDTKPDVTVRAPGVNASLLEPTSKPKAELPVLFASALAATLTVLLGASPLARRLLKVKLVASALPGRSLEQNEVVSYICAKAGLEEEAEKLRFSSAQLSYRGTADYLMFRAIDSEKPKRERYKIALKAMLLNEHMSPQSITSIRRAIGKLSDDPSIDESTRAIEKQAVGEGDDPGKLRDAIDSLIESELGVIPTISR